MKDFRYIFFLFTIGLASCQQDVQPPDESNQDEIYSGGQNFTSFDFGQNAFGKEGNSLTADESKLFAIGNSLFRSNWVSAPSSVSSLDGLGPMFNAISCGSCHFKDGRAAPFNEFEVKKPGILWKLSIEGKGPHGEPIPHSVYGDQFQDNALTDVTPEAQVTTTYQEIRGQYSDGTVYYLQKPIYKVENLAYGSIEEKYNLSPRISPHIAGLGLLESISEEDIISNQDLNDENQDGISGKANYVWDVKSQSQKLGRFGWKANQPNIFQQVSAAFNADMGLTSSLFPEENISSYQKSKLSNTASGGEPEVTDQQLSRITSYVQSLSIPAAQHTDTPEYQLGKKIFFELKCSSCHIPSYTTKSGNTISSLDNQKIYPYTDLLLHDMGEELADNRSDFLANGKEWKTPPLWGIGLIPIVNKHTRLLHDGRARNIEEAILWHGGEASKSRDDFKTLSRESREALIFFLKCH